MLLRIAPSKAPAITLHPCIPLTRFRILPRCSLSTAVFFLSGRVDPAQLCTLTASVIIPLRLSLSYRIILLHSRVKIAGYLSVSSCRSRGIAESSQLVRPVARRILASPGT
ncbi:hypothetical protein K440DRAFT_23435 [Wilcoxina mikolae CBS 423.85]|nr:hypothetical protein K440DRAFT_23435 [Wilcoxina mikolae CBS 423.85]